MKYKLIPAAVLGLLAGSALAQSSVTLYGTLDGGVLSQNSSAQGYSTTIPGATADKGHLTKFQDGGIGASNWGIRGSEDLGGGLKANFQLQGNISLATGASNPISGAVSPRTSAAFNQVAMLGLSGGWGEVKMGRQISPLYYAVAFTDPREGRYFGSILGAMVGMNSSAGWAGTTTNVPLSTVYDDSSVVYTSPNMGGVTVNYQHTFGNIDGSSRAGARDAITLLYNNGAGLRLSAVYYNAADSYTLPTNATGKVNNRVTHLGAKYAFGQFSVGAGFMNAKNPSGMPAGMGVVNAASPALGSTAGNSNYDTWSVGVGYTFSPALRLLTGYYHIKDKNNGANKSDLWAAGMDYSLSKRTTAYLQVGHVQNKGTMNQALVYGTPVAAGVTTTGYMLGLRHSF